MGCEPVTVSLYPARNNAQPVIQMGTGGVDLVFIKGVRPLPVLVSGWISRGGSLEGEM